MQLNIGLMGFGRIGRNLFRILYDREDVQVAAVSDVADHKNLEYLLKYDTIMGRFPAAVSVTDGHLYAAGKQVRMLSGKEPGDVPWGDLGVDVVVEATARYRSRAQLQRHIDAGAKKVLLCVPPLDNPDITVVMGVNQDKLERTHQIISNGSITGELRRSRAASENIIPTDTNSQQVLEELLPNLEGKLSALAMKVPVPNGSLVDMTLFTEKPVTVAAVNEVVRTGVDAHYKHIVEYVEDPIVSSDVKRSPYSSTFDSLATMTLGDHLVKTVAWYDNGWGYAHRVVDMLEYLAQGDLL
jgi:glyceraldehyde 3-phosphate dehydrogenase